MEMCGIHVKKKKRIIFIIKYIRIISIVKGDKCLSKLQTFIKVPFE